MCHHSRFREGRLLNFDPGFDITPTSEPLGFEYGKDCFGPRSELRPLDAIRLSLRDPNASGPDPVYAIAMDVGKPQHRQEFQQRMLLFGCVTYAKGQVGDEVVRSQGHVHKISSHSGWAAPEIYESFSIETGPGNIVVIPPGWAHTSLSANPNEHLTFGALCDREYGFVYDEVRRRRGLAWYALIDQHGKIYWEPNPHYRKSFLTVRGTRNYRALGIELGIPLYSQFEKNPDKLQWVSKPGVMADLWNDFAP
jgi:glucose-6-phosphate isomerase